MVLQLTVVAQGDELDVEDTALVLADAADADGVAAAEIAIEAGLGAIGLVEDADAGTRGARAAEGLGLADILAQGSADVLGGGDALAVTEAQGDAGGVAVEDGDAVAGGADAEAVLFDEDGGVGAQGAEDLARLRLQLVLLARDVRYHVVEDVHAADARVPGPRHRLHCDDADGLDGAEPRLQSRERDHKPDHRAVGVAHQEAFLETALLALVGDQVQVRQVDGGYDEGHEGIPSVVLGVREDGEVGVLKFQLCCIWRTGSIR